VGAAVGQGVVGYDAFDPVDAEFGEGGGGAAEESGAGGGVLCTVAAVDSRMASSRPRAARVRWWWAASPCSPRTAAAKLSNAVRVPLVSNQPQYSILWRVIEAEVIPACDELGIGQLVWSPLAGGVLTGKYRPGGPLPSDSRAATRGGARSIGRWHYLGEDVLDVVGRLVPLAESAGLSMAQLALAWVLKNPSVTSAIVGASRPAQLRENLKALDTVLDDDLYALINETADPVVRRDPALTEDPLGPAPTRSGAPAAASAAR
jgi:hypothetical protein